MYDCSQCHLDTSREGSNPGSSHLAGKIGVVLLELSWSFGEQDNDGIDSRSNRSQEDAAQDESNNKSKTVDVNRRKSS